jgi:hypothetical protein
MYTNAGGWADHNCREPYVFICEVGSALSYPSFTAPGSNHTFTFYSTPMAYDAAETACNADGGHLASYSDLQEQVRGRRWFLALPAFAQLRDAHTGCWVQC